MKKHSARRRCSGGRIKKASASVGCHPGGSRNWTPPDASRLCSVCRRCRAQTLHHSSDRRKRQQPAQSPHLVRVSHTHTHTHTHTPAGTSVSRVSPGSIHTISFFFSPSFNRIDIPPYESYDKLYDKLLTAIEETCGFAVEWEARWRVCRGVCVYMCVCVQDSDGLLSSLRRTDSLPLLSPRSTFSPYRCLFEQLLLFVWV